MEKARRRSCYGSLETRRQRSVAKMKREKERERRERLQGVKTCEKKAEKRAVVKLKAKAEIETRFTRSIFAPVRVPRFRWATIGR